MSELTPSRTSFLTLVRFFERCQKQKKPSKAETDLKKLLHVFQSSEEGRTDLFSFYRLVFPKAYHFALFCVAERDW